MAAGVAGRSVKPLARPRPEAFVEAALGETQGRRPVRCRRRCRAAFSAGCLPKFFREEPAVLRDAGFIQDWINEGVERGRKQGRLEGEVAALQSAIVEVLAERFGALKRGLAQKLAEMDDPAVLRALLRKSATAESLEEFVRLLEQV